MESDKHGDNPDRKLWPVIDWIPPPFSLFSPSHPRFQHLTRFRPDKHRRLPRLPRWVNWILKLPGLR